METFKTLFLIMSAAALFSCAAKKSKIITLNYMNPESSPNQLVIMQKIISRFEKTHPGIKINVITGVRTEKIYSTIASGSGLDVFYGYENILDYYERNAIISLNPYIEKFGFNQDEYFPISIQMVSKNHKILGLPIQLKTDCIGYNKTLLEKSGLPLPPLSWHMDEFENYIKKLYAAQKANADKYNKIYPITGIPMPRHIMTPQIIDEISGKLNTSEKIKKELLAKLIQEQRIWSYLPPRTETRELASTAGASGTTAIFSMQRAFLQYAPAWTLIDLGKIRDFDWDVTEGIYWKDNEIVPVSDAYLSIAAISKYPEIAYKFIKFYASQSGAGYFAASKNGMSAHIASTKKFFIAPPANINTYITIVETRKMLNTRPPLKNWIQFQRTFEGTSYGEEFYTGKVSAQKYMEEYYKTSSGILEPFIRE
ncbi:MAG: hypothetical protein A2096_02345 [Spirochaetes bacterium GWF1_41_5]|nr:MAG: hypothetical protein A2096_02345 [Spirochaetes bacterium GWF1_41_5]